MAHQQYRPLDVDSVLAFAAPYLPGPPEGAAEIGDGNLNLVFRVHSSSGSVVVKQALPYLRLAGEAWPLTRHRTMIEAAAIDIHGKYAPRVLPHVYDVSEPLSAIVLEDLRELRTWRRDLIDGVATPDVAATIGRYVASTHVGTSIATLSREDRHRLHRRFGYSELCQVTDKLVFTDPFEDSDTNRADGALVETAARLRADHTLRRETKLLRHRFRTRSEALIHGDLHTGSVMSRPDSVGSTGDVRVIDLEFAFFGPVGFDPAMVLANLAFARLAHDAVGDDEFSRVIDGYAADFWQALMEESRRLWPAHEPWWDRYRSTLLADAAQYAGLEAIRRTVGMAKVADIQELPEPARFRVQGRCLAAGRSLILGPRIGHFDELWHRLITEETFA